MPYYYTCPQCGSNLDPGEQCSDCREKEIALSAANAEGDRVDIELTSSNLLQL